MKFFLTGLLALTISTAKAQDGNLKVILSKATCRLSVYNNEKLLHQDVSGVEIKWDSTKKEYIITVDPKAMCTGCKENSARGVLYLYFTIKGSSVRFVVNPALDTKQFNSYNNYYPVFTKDGQPDFIDVRQHNGDNIEYRFDFSMFNTYNLELLLYKPSVVNNQLSFTEVPEGKVKMTVAYKKRPVFNAPKVAQ